MATEASKVSEKNRLSLRYHFSVMQNLFVITNVWKQPERPSIKNSPIKHEHSYNGVLHNLQKYENYFHSGYFTKQFRENADGRREDNILHLYKKP